MTRNPYVIGLLSMAGHLFVVAFMLGLVIAELTDYTAYDLATVATVQAWMLVLVILAGTAIIGAAVLAGISWSQRETTTPSLPRTTPTAPRHPSPDRTHPAPRQPHLATSAPSHRYPRTPAPHPPAPTVTSIARHAPDSLGAN